MCQTLGCIDAAAHVLDKMDTTIEPCDDFYNFACGNLIRKTQTSDMSWDMFTIAEDKVKKDLGALFSKEFDPNDPKFFNLPKKLYRACMYNGPDEYRIMNTLLAGWPVVMGDKWNESGWSWTSAVKEFRKTGYKTNYIFDTTIDPDYNFSMQILLIFL